MGAFPNLFKQVFHYFLNDTLSFRLFLCFVFGAGSDIFSFMRQKGQKERAFPTTGLFFKHPQQTAAKQHPTQHARTQSRSLT